MDCGIIDECRCYAYDDTKKPERNQFCGKRQGLYVSPCPKACCAGGCPGESTKESRPPFRIIERPPKLVRNDTLYFNRYHILAVFTIFTLFFLLFHDLKIKPVRKI